MTCFLRAYDNVVTKENFDEYLYKLKKANYSHSHCNQIINSVKLYASITNHPQKNFFVYHHRPKKQNKLPKVLAKTEVKAIFDCTKNPKHLTILKMAYSCGMRVGEVAALTVNDIDSKRMVVIIRQGKGRKDRIVPLSDAMLVQLRNYYRLYRPTYWLFEGATEDKHITIRTLQRTFNKGAEKAGIRKSVTFHSLRHAYATHLLESGVDLRFIQELLGHASSKTTERYTHVCNHSLGKIINPLDTLDDL